jgi:Mrp family chromosome partitioning ATPase
VGEELVRLGYASEADVAHASTVQSQSYVGLLDVLSGEGLEDCVTGTGKPGLFVLPLGSARPHNAGQLSPAAVQRIVTEARAAFDVVLIDTGPVLGSLEAPIVATQSDAVVLVMARGEQHSLAKRAIDRLMGVGARTAGIVFNRAASSEVTRFAFSSSSSSRTSSQRKLPPAESGLGQPTMRPDTLTSAVGSSTTAPSKPR